MQGGKRKGAGRPKGRKPTKQIQITLELYLMLKKLKGTLTFDQFLKSILGK